MDRTGPPLFVLQTCYSRSWGGLEMQALEVSRQLACRGHTVWLSAPPGSRLDEEARSAGLRTLPLNIRGYIHPRLLVHIASWIRGQGIDIVHSHHSKDLATLSPALRLVGRHVPLILSKRMGSGIRKTDPLHRFTYARVDRVLAISSVIRQNVLDTTPMSSDRVLLLFDAVDTAKFSPAVAREPGAVRRSLGVPEVGLLAGCVGRISPGKGHEELLDATRILKERGLRFTLLIAGEAGYGERDYEERIRSRTTELGLGQDVVFSGFRRDVPDLLHALDLFVFPSHAEAFGLALIEAMAMARPVVSTNTDGVLDIMVDGVTGLMVPPRDAASLAAGMEQLLTDGPLRLRCGTAGRERVLERFDQRTQIDLLEGIYARVIAEARGPAAPSR